MKLTNEQMLMEFVLNLKEQNILRKWEMEELKRQIKENSTHFQVFTFLPYVMLVRKSKENG